MLSTNKTAKGQFIAIAAASMMALLVAAPVIAIALHWLSPDVAVLKHLWQTQIVQLLINTLLLALGVGITATVIGVSSALLVSLFNFKGRKLIEWLLVLPLDRKSVV